MGNIICPLLTYIYRRENLHDLDRIREVSRVHMGILINTYKKKIPRDVVCYTRR